jgi:hypothetical protein
MCDFNSLDDAAKQQYHLRLKTCADAIGGPNFFLQILEDIRRTKPHPIIAKQCVFKSSRGTIHWNKVIFKDKLTLLMQERIHESERGNFLPDETDKQYKKVLNLVRTLGPVTFTVTPKNRKDGEGFTVQPFERIDEQTTRLDPLFDALFFCSVDTVKRVLNYTPKA